MAFAVLWLVDNSLSALLGGKLHELYFNTYTCAPINISVSFGQLRKQNHSCVITCILWTLHILCLLHSGLYPHWNWKNLTCFLLRWDSDESLHWTVTLTFGLQCHYTGVFNGWTFTRGLVGAYFSLSENLNSPIKPLVAKISAVQRFSFCSPNKYIFIGYRQQTTVPCRILQSRSCTRCNSHVFYLVDWDPGSSYFFKKLLKIMAGSGLNAVFHLIGRLWTIRTKLGVKPNCK